MHSPVYICIWMVSFPDTGVSALSFLRKQLTSMHVQESEEAVDHVLGQCHDVIREHKKINRELVDVRDDIEILEKLVQQKTVNDYVLQQRLGHPRMPLFVHNVLIL